MSVSSARGNCSGGEKEQSADLERGKKRLLCRCGVYPQASLLLTHSGSSRKPAKPTGKQMQNPAQGLLPEQVGFAELFLGNEVLAV